MLFNSLTFIVFFGAVLALHYSPLPWRTKKLNLLVASYLFYAAWSPPFVLLLWLSTMVDWSAGNRLSRETRPAARRLLLLASLAANLGMLGFFKYGGFLLENFVAVVGALGIDYHPATPDIVLPVGISFYTFQTLAYTLDIYLGRERPARSFLDFALFVTFFPQLVAGPIVRPTQLIPQFQTPKRATSSQFGWGLGLMTLGLFEKVVVADMLLAPAADAVFGSQAQLHWVDAWLGVLAFSGQIFSDFAGYSTIAIGVALTLGFHLPDNFRFPYAALGFSDFWRRWHISLSSWLRDYLYIPLGGNRKGRIRAHWNLMATMLLGGLWHGAAWTFVVWGALHGTFLAVERLLKLRFGDAREIRSGLNKFLLGLLTYFLVNVTWVFFRAQDFGTAWRLLGGMFGLGAESVMVLPVIHMIQVAVVISVMLGVHGFMRNRRLADVVSSQPWWLVGGVWAAMLVMIILTQGEADAFIYFQF